MEFLNKARDWLNSNISMAFGVPALLSGTSFAANIIQSISDGHLSHSELQGLITSSTGIETVILLVLSHLIKR